MARRIRWRAVLSGGIALALARPALTQAGMPQSAAANESASASWICRLPDVRPRTMVSDARPGAKDFAYGAVAFRKRDYRHAVYMFKVAASWADEAAEYNLGLIYFRGQGAPVDRPLGAAWMVLAAERGNPFYAHARDLLVTSLTTAEFQRMDNLWSKLRQTYGDKAALGRAKAQWTWVRTHEGTSLRWIGGTGAGALGPNGFRTIAGSFAGKPAEDAMWQTNNPYDYHYNGQFSDCPTGTVKVGPLRQASSDDGGAPQSSAHPGSSANPSENPDQDGTNSHGGVP